MSEITKSDIRLLSGLALHLKTILECDPSKPKTQNAWRLIRSKELPKLQQRLKEWT